jgi:dTDP-4-amino-4,6-dideoxygalactose transaminase
LKLLFDAAHALGCTHHGRPVGGFGAAEVFSFHATKFLNTFEGGAVTTNDDLLAEKMRLMKNFGFSGYDNVIYVGTNGKMTEVAAAMGLTSLESFDAFCTVNQRNYHEYRRQMQALPGFRLVQYDEREKNNYQYVVLLVDEAVTGLSRDDLVRVLHAENVLARRYFYPGCHRMEPYRSYYPHAHLLLPATEAVLSKVLLLPTGLAVDCEQVRTICRLLALAIEEPQRINCRLASPIAG